MKMKIPSSYAQVAGEDDALPLPPKEEPEPPKEEPKAPEHLPPKEEPEEKFGKQGRGLGAPRSCASPSPGAVGLVSNRLPQPLGRRRGNRGSVDRGSTELRQEMVAAGGAKASFETHVRTVSAGS